MPRRPHPPARLVDVLNDTRGLAQVEYIVTVSVVGLVLAAVFVLRSDALLADYVNARNLFLVPAI